MTNNEIKELTDIIMKADVYEVLDEGLKEHRYLFRYKTDTKDFQFSYDADTEEEARKLALNFFISRFRAMEPKKNWSKRILDEPSTKNQRRLIRLKMKQIAEPFKRIKYCENFWFVISPQGDYVMKKTMLSAIKYAESIGKNQKDVWEIRV